jgi:hydrogenase nickel incorporation protein HypA/HybF
MHELSVTESILEICTRNARQSGASRVTTINLTIGRLSSIVDDSVQFYWDIISEGTLCAGALLVFKRLPAKMRCNDCGTEYRFDSDLIPCPSCQSMNACILGGDEFQVESIEIETNEDVP